MHSLTLISFFAYFCVLLAIGLISHKKQRSAADFIMGNRSLNFWLTALSAHASDMSAWLFMGFPAAIFIGGLSQSWIAFGLLGGMFCNWQFVAKPLRTMTEKYDSYTLSTFFENRYHDKSGVLRISTALISVFFLTCYVASGLISMGLLIESVFGIDYYVGLGIATLVVVTYTLVGGFITVAWTDTFQALFLLAVVMIVPIIAFFSLKDGVSHIQAVAHSKQVSLAFFKDYSFESILGIIFLIFSWGLGYFGQPHIVTKFMGIKDANEMNKSKYVGMTWQFLTLLFAVLVGVVSLGFFPSGLEDSRLVFIEMVKQLFHPLVAGFVLCAVLAATMSTIDSQMLVCSSVLSEDFYKKIFRKTASDLELLRVSRLGIVLVSGFSIMLAFNRNTSVIDAVHYAWSGLGSSFGPLVLMSLYSKKTNRYGAIAGVIVGGIIAGGWHLVNPYLTVYVVPPMIPGFLLSLTSIYVVSKMTQSEHTNGYAKTKSSALKDS